MSVPALASGARALARIPVLFSTSFRHSVIFFTVTAILGATFSAQELLLGFLMKRFYCGPSTAASLSRRCTQGYSDPVGIPGIPKRKTASEGRVTGSDAVFDNFL